MKYTNSMFLANVDYVRKQKGEKVGELEKAVEVSTGYFARLSKNPETMPGAEVLIKIALHYGVPIDCLLLYSYSTYTEEEKILSDYIEKIISWTMNGWIKWEKTDRVMAMRQPEINSLFPHRMPVYQNGMTYMCELKDGSKTKITPISSGGGGEIVWWGYELTVYDSSTQKWLPICATDLVSDMMQMRLKNLYMTVGLKESQFSVDGDTKDFITRFLAQENKGENND